MAAGTSEFLELHDLKITSAVTARSGGETQTPHAFIFCRNLVVHTIVTMLCTNVDTFFFEAIRPNSG